MNPNDKSTWNLQTKLNMPTHRRLPVKEISPKAWGAIQDLVGENITEHTQLWRDNVIVNLGFEGCETMEHVPFEKLPGYHADGDFFRHFLDSPEAAALCTPVWSEQIVEDAGATIICPDSIEIMAKFLAEHPEGVMPGEPFNYSEKVRQCREFVELTGKRGDVVLMHPFMIHTASINYKRIPRFITNPAVCVTEPMRYDKPDDQLTLVERKTLLALGKKSYSFKPAGERKSFPGKREELFKVMRAQEAERVTKAHAAELNGGH